MRHHASLPFVAGAMLLLGACATGPGVDKYTPALTPAGVGIVARLTGGEISGELLEVRDSGVVVLQATELLLIPFDAIRSFRLAHESVAYPGGPPTRTVRERMRLLSRFPTGLSAEHLARLLAARGQQTLPVYAPAIRADTAAEADFLARARASTARFRDITVARDAGYRRLGGDLPSLGEHWVHGGRAIADTLDPTAPSILVYVRVAGRPVLAGLAWTRFLEPGETPPEFPRSHPGAWHEHNGAVDDEVLPLAHHEGAPGAGAMARLRIAVMHAWLWVPNPAGVWASENWGLPYVRLGLAPDAGPGGLDARALSLAASSEYYLRALGGVGQLDEREAARVERILATYAARAAGESARFAAGRGAGGIAHDPAIAHDPSDAAHGASGAAAHASEADAALVALWNSLWREVSAAVRPEVAARLTPLRAALAGESH